MSLWRGRPRLQTLREKLLWRPRRPSTGRTHADRSTISLDLNPTGAGQDTLRRTAPVAQAPRRGRATVCCRAVGVLSRDTAAPSHAPTSHSRRIALRIRLRGQAGKGIAHPQDTSIPSHGPCPEVRLGSGTRPRWIVMSSGGKDSTFHQTSSRPAHLRVQYSCLKGMLCPVGPQGVILPWPPPTTTYCPPHTCHRHLTTVAQRLPEAHPPSKGSVRLTTRHPSPDLFSLRQSRLEPGILQLQAPPLHAPSLDRQTHRQTLPIAPWPKCPPTKYKG